MRLCVCVCVCVCTRACIHACTRLILAAVLKPDGSYPLVVYIWNVFSVDCVCSLSLLLTGHVQEEPDEYLLLQDLIALHRRGVQDVRYKHTHTDTNTHTHRHTHTHNPNAHTQRETHRTNIDNLNPKPKPHSVKTLTNDEPYTIQFSLAHSLTDGLSLAHPLSHTGLLS